ncbi:type III pantothenate kinase [Marinobacter sp.]|uniref:type III pantothenate kinase n=1 Tax=Marinobacter sp. TaxID=50741 RepID=UPI0035C703CF
MKLFIDAGNTRLKWCLEDSGKVTRSGAGVLGDQVHLEGLDDRPDISAIAVSTVASEARREQLAASLVDLCPTPARFYWAEAGRGGLRNAYQEVARMGADRWHAMYGAWLSHKNGFAVVDAGSAVTVDYVDALGQHLGGYILPGLRMMVRSLQNDAARIWFDPEQVLETAPGRSTGECVNHGLAWLSEAMVERVQSDARTLGLRDILVTGGDAGRLIGLGLTGTLHPDLVFAGLRAIDAEDAAE